MAAATGIPAVIWTIIWILAAFGILMVALRLYVAARDRAFDKKKDLPFEPNAEA
jgi:4-hydroxybenzoate polyprenyltransferase